MQKSTVKTLTLATVSLLRIPVVNAFGQHLFFSCYNSHLLFSLVFAYFPPSFLIFRSSCLVHTPMIAGMHFRIGLGLILHVLVVSSVPSDIRYAQAGGRHLVAKLKRATPKPPALRLSNGTDTQIFDAHIAVRTI